MLTSSSGTAAQPQPYRPPFTAHQGGPQAAFEPNSVLVKFKPKASSSARRATISKVRGTTEDSVNAKVVEVEGDLAAPDLLKKVKADPAVEEASLNYVRRISAVPNDTYYQTDQTVQMNTVRMPQAWDLSKSTGTLKIAVLDTGVDAGHPDLVGHLWPGYNAVSSTRPNPVDDNGHGTMTLGIIAAAANNAVGVAGVGWNAKAMPVKVIGANGSGNDADIIEGLNWAVSNGAKVVNMSFGSLGDDPLLHQAIQQAVAAGVTVVAAAGNDGNSALQYPASYPEVIAVAATSPSGSLTDFSSYGDWVDVAAPGFDVLTTGPRDKTPAANVPYWYCTGTSCSAPIVTGIAALVKNKYPTLTPAQVAQRLETLARDAGPRGFDQYYGYGIVDAYSALGGRFTADFPAAGEDGNDQPVRATSLTVDASNPTSTTGTVGIEGDVDWYAVESSGVRNLSVSVTGPIFSCNNTANFGPQVDAYNPQLIALAHGVNEYPATPIDPATGCPKPVALTETVAVSAEAGATYIAVRNANGSAGGQQYTLTVKQEGAGQTPNGTAYPVKDVNPHDLGRNAALDTAPTVRFAREVAADSVNATNVRLVNGKTKSTVGATVSFDAATNVATIHPSAPLLDNTPYRIAVSGVQGGGGGTVAPFTSVFSTADNIPAALGSFDASGLYLAANLSWKIPVTGDLDQVIVRRNVGSKPPAINTGTLVYAGTGSAVKNTGLAQGVTYTYGAWVTDRTGHSSPIATTQLLGMKTGISTTSTLLTYGGAITLRGSTLRIDNIAYAGLPTNLYVRPKTSSTFKLLAALKTSATGTVSFVDKPTVSSVYMMTFPGNADLMGTRTPDITVQVAPSMASATLAPAAIRLGQATAFSGYVAPAHAGKLVYLQQYGNKVWKSIASVKLSTSGKFAFGIKPAVRGQIAYRVWFPADADHAQAYTVNKILTVS
ncbi:S8 family serine peptidase [Kribbella sp. NPDC026611]|uniref:S8 family serine peptidase n=1 Tax=Kribbella sp. NPDC026611 TaxID=3154911 RepID=UPI0033EF82F4